jgi:hypothetical protein
MQLYRGLTIEQVIEQQDTLFQRIPVEIDPQSRENDCYPNCVAKVERDGGFVVVGWRRTCAILDAELIATLDHHAVWHNPSGALVDISQHVKCINNTLTIFTDEYTYFLSDPAATFTDYKSCRPSRHMPMVPDTHGYLKKACERMDSRAEAIQRGDEAKANYELGKIQELLQSDQHRRS